MRDLHRLGGVFVCGVWETARSNGVFEEWDRLNRNRLCLLYSPADIAGCAVWCTGHGPVGQEV